jgi:hypothetical protein
MRAIFEHPRWKLYKEIAAIRGLLQWIGIWDWLVRWFKRLIGATVVAALTFAWSRIKHLAAPEQFVLALVLLR